MFKPVRMLLKPLLLYNPNAGIPQALLLKRILQQAVMRTAFYKPYQRLLRQNALATEVPQDWPILEKQALASSAKALTSHGYCFFTERWNSSGGTQGTPVRILQDAYYRQVVRACTFQHKRKVGYSFGQPLFKLWGDEREILAGSISFRAQLRSKLFSETMFNAFRMTEASMHKLYVELNRQRPQLLVAYASALYEFCKFIKQNSLNVQAIPAVISSAGMLYPFMREQIEETLRTKVYNRYGSREVGMIAGELIDSEGLLVEGQNVFIEVLDANGQINVNGEGELLVTSLSNFSMPLIRYRIGDYGVLHAGPAQGSQVIKNLRGREVDLFRSSAGVLIDGEFFTHLLYNRSYIEQFQCIQNEAGLIEFKLKLRAPMPEADQLEIIEAVQKLMGQSTSVSFKEVTAIEPEKSGKFRYTIREAS